MPTLLAVNNYYYSRGGAETVFFGHNRLFEAAGWNVVPFAMKHPKNFATPWSRFFVDEIEFGGEYSLGQKLARAPKVIYSFEARAKLKRLLAEVDVDICHAHNLYHHISPSILGLLKARGIPVVLTLHDLKIACPAYNMLAPDGVCERCRGGRLYNVVVHKCIKGSTALSGLVMLEAVLHRLLGSYRDCVSRFIVPSRFYIEKLVEWGMPRALFQHVPNFVDLDRYTPAYTPGSYFVFFGRIAREKGVATLIKAAAQAGCDLQIIGTGPQLAEMQELAGRLKANVSFRGHLSGDALHDAIRNARAAVLPSEWYENAPMSVLEAYALGKPAIGARIGGIPELIQEGVTGFTFPSGDHRKLAEVLTGMVERPVFEIEAMGRAGRQWVEAHASAPVYRQRMLDAYRDLGVHHFSYAAGDT